MITGSLVVLAVPAFPVGAEASPNSPAQQCRAERVAMGETNFKTTYGTNSNQSNAFGKCVSRHAGQQNGARVNASRRCRAEQQDPNFAAAHGGKTFAQFYGTNRNGRNAHGKCVSSKAAQATEQIQKSRLNAARRCRAEQRLSRTAFGNTYGTNRNKRNAFGRCVSRHD